MSNQSGVSNQSGYYGGRGIQIRKKWVVDLSTHHTLVYINDGHWDKLVATIRSDYTDCTLSRTPTTKCKTVLHNYFLCELWFQDNLVCVKVTLIHWWLALSRPSHCQTTTTGPNRMWKISKDIVQNARQPVKMFCQLLSVVINWCFAVTLFAQNFASMQFMCIVHT